MTAACRGSNPVHRDVRDAGPAVGRCDSNGGRIPGICLERCTYELRQAQAMYAANGLPVRRSRSRRCPP